MKRSSREDSKAFYFSIWIFFLCSIVWSLPCFCFSITLHRESSEWIKKQHQQQKWSHNFQFWEPNNFILLHPHPQIWLKTFWALLQFHKLSSCRSLVELSWASEWDEKGKSATMEIMILNETRQLFFFFSFSLKLFF